MNVEVQYTLVKSLVVAGDQWAKMTNDQRKAALSRVHHIDLEEASPNKVSPINAKLVEGESAVFQQILSAGVDWITPRRFEAYC